MSAAEAVAGEGWGNAGQAAQSHQNWGKVKGNATEGLGLRYNGGNARTPAATS